MVDKWPPGPPPPPEHPLPPDWIDKGYSGSLGGVVFFLVAMAAFCLGMAWLVIEAVEAWPWL